MKVSETMAAMSEKLEAADLQGRDVTLSISHVELVKFDDGSRAKFKLHFAETPKGFILNVTNTDSMVWNFGDETEDWIGQKVTFWPTVTRFEGRQVPCIRIRPVANPAMQQAPRNQGQPIQQGLPPQQSTLAPARAAPNANPNTYQEASQGLPAAQGQQYGERNPPPQQNNPLDDEIPF